MPNRTAACAATYDGDRCPADTQVLTWCRYHWQQQYQGRPFTEHKPRRRRGSASERDAHGRKQCPRCDHWRHLSDFTPAANTVDGYQSWCSPCAADYMSVARYGLTRAEVATLLKQQGGCAICGTTQPRGTDPRRGWHVDHDHACCSGGRTCGQCVRGILCADCNLLIGHAADSVVRLLQAVGYLRQCEAKHEQPTQG